MLARNRGERNIANRASKVRTEIFLCTIHVPNTTKLGTDPFPVGLKEREYRQAPPQFLGHFELKSK